MSFIASVSKIDLPDRVAQQKVKEYAKDLFIADFPLVEKLISVFDSTGIDYRNFCKPLDTYAAQNSFEDNNNDYVRLALAYSIQAIDDCMAKCPHAKEDITDIIFVSSTGLATPGLDALIINKMRLNPNINRMSVFGLGCAGGVSGMAKANTIAKADPAAIVLLVTVELCSLTFLRNDYSKSNFVASSLFSDGIAATLVVGDNYQFTQKIEILGARSKLYYDTLDVMGWQFKDTGFKVVFSQDIPTLINQNIKQDVTDFLSIYGLELSDITNFILHPGGKKVLIAYSDALQVAGDFLETTREVMYNYGNMSGATVLYVLEQFLQQDYEDGYGLMMAMGPGFSSEMVLLKMNKQ